MTEIPYTDKWIKTFIKNDDDTYSLRIKTTNPSDIEIGAVEIKDAVENLRATLEDRGGKGAITVQIVDSNGNQITSFSSSITKLKDSEDNIINPSTEDKQDDIKSVLDNIKLKTDNITDDPAIATKQDDIISLLNEYNVNDIEEPGSSITYIGKEDSEGNWYVIKIDESSSPTTMQHATATNNTESDYSTAWTNRTSLTYQDYKDAF